MNLGYVILQCRFTGFLYIAYYNYTVRQESSFDDSSPFVFIQCDAVYVLCDVVFDQMGKQPLHCNFN